MTKEIRSKKEKEYEYFDGKKYFLHQGYWITTIRPYTFLSHDIWNYYHSEDKIIKGDSCVIHHQNEDSSDDRIENLQKMTKGEHISLHKWRGDVKFKLSYLFSKTIKKKKCSLYQSINSFGEVLSSRFIVQVKR